MMSYVHAPRPDRGLFFHCTPSNVCYCFDTNERNPMLNTLLLACLLSCSSVNANLVPEHLAWQGPVMFINGDITPDTVMSMINLVESAFANHELRVIINSSGGDADAGNAIYDGFRALDSTGIKVRCLVTGRAMSAAFTLLQGCTTRYTLDISRLMLHEPLAVYTPRPGNTNPLVLSISALRAALEGMEASLTAIVNAVAPRLGMTNKALRAKIRDTRWDMTPQEALKARAIDAIWRDSVELFVRQQNERPKATK